MQSNNCGYYLFLGAQYEGIVHVQKVVFSCRRELEWWEIHINMIFWCKFMINILYDEVICEVI